MPTTDDRIVSLLETVVKFAQEMRQSPSKEAEPLPENEVIYLNSEEPDIPVEMRITATEVVSLMQDKNGKPLASATKKAYSSRIKSMEKCFPNEDLINLIRDDIYRVLFEVKCRHDSLSTQRQCFSVISGIMKELDIPDKANIGSIIKENRDENDTLP